MTDRAERVSPGLRILAFDFDGTLADTNALKRDTYFRVLAPHGIEPGLLAAVLNDHPSENRYGVIREALARAGQSSSPTAVERLAEAYGDICERGAIERPAMPGAEAALAVLSRSCALYVNSATPEASLRRIIERRGWMGYFRGVLGLPSDKVRNLQTVMSRESAGAGEVVMVGDSPADRDAAAEVGCRFVAVPGFPRGRLHEDGLWIPGLHALPEVLDRMWFERAQR
jgi:phosphoglycolate phosphatase-like HAD superfamily hydrolase